MQYRTLGKTGRQVSALGFGAMRLPTCGTEADVDRPAAIEMIRFAVDHGVNYIDSAYPYHGGHSERVVGEALADGYRDKASVATKMPIWLVKSAADFDRLFEEQLDRLGTDRLDFYLLHNVQAKSWPRLRELGATDWLAANKRRGRIGHVGFSFHDTYDAFCDVVDGFDWDFCQIQYNYICEFVQAGTLGLKYAAAKGLGVVIMEPLFGGTLASPPESMCRVFEDSGIRRRPVDLALSWLWDRPEISLVLSGMSTLRQVRENVRLADRSGTSTLDDDARSLVTRLQVEYENLSPIPCTSCGYCLPCPLGVSIPVNFELYNNGVTLQGSSFNLCRALYKGLPEMQRAQSCTACEECLVKCPQGIDISRLMPEIHKKFMPDEK